MKLSGKFYTDPPDYDSGDWTSHRVILMTERGEKFSFKFSFNGKIYTTMIARLRKIAQNCLAQAEDWLLGFPIEEIRAYEDQLAPTIQRCFELFVSTETFSKPYTNPIPRVFIDTNDEALDPLEILRNGTEAEKETIRNLAHKINFP